MLPSHNGEREFAFEVENVGEVPALQVTINVSDSGGLFDDPAFFLGVIFPRQSTSIRFPVPESFTYAPHKELSHFAPASPTEGQRRSLGENVEDFIPVYPEGFEAALVTCHITYLEPLILGFLPARNFQTVQLFRVEHSGKAQPARSKQAKVR